MLITNLFLISKHEFPFGLVGLFDGFALSISFNELVTSLLTIIMEIKAFLFKIFDSSTAESFSLKSWCY